MRGKTPAAQDQHKTVWIFLFALHHPQVFFSRSHLTDLRYLYLPVIKEVDALLQAAEVFQALLMMSLLHTHTHTCRREAVKYLAVVAWKYITYNKLYLIFNFRDIKITTLDIVSFNHTQCTLILYALVAYLSCY